MKAIFMCKNAREKRLVKKSDFYMDAIRKNVGKCMDKGDFLAAKCWESNKKGKKGKKGKKADTTDAKCKKVNKKGKKFNTSNAIKALDALKRINPEEDIFLVAITWDRTPTDWLDSDTPEPTTGKIDTERKTEYYTPFSSTAHLMSRGEIKDSRENEFKDLQVVLGDKATVLRIHEGDVFNMRDEIKRLKDTHKANPTLSWKDIPASEMWELTTEIGSDANGAKARDMIFAAGAHPILWDDDIIIHVHEGCNHPIRWKEVNDVPYADQREIAENQEEDGFRYTGWSKIPLFECPHCGEVLTREDYMAGKEAAKKAIEEAYVIYAEYRKKELEAEKAKKEAAEKAAALKEANAKKQLAIATR